MCIHAPAVRNTYLFLSKGVASTSTCFKAHSIQNVNQCQHEHIGSLKVQQARVTLTENGLLNDHPKSTGTAALRLNGIWQGGIGKVKLRVAISRKPHQLSF